MKTLELFNAVVAKESHQAPFVSSNGLVIDSKAVWAKKAILSYYSKEMLDGYGLNQTFHKSWFKIQRSPQEELRLNQIAHYYSTYGSGFTGEMYLPVELLEVPDQKVVFKVVNAYSKEELTQKCLDLFKSGIALKEETIHTIVAALLDELDYRFTGAEEIRNKEAEVILADTYNVIPTNTLSFFRFIIYKATGDSLLIKSNDAIEAIKNSSFNPSALFNQHGLEKLATIFNRFKPLFLAFKAKCPKTINKISKLSKMYHVPLTVNPLNHVTSMALQNKDLHWLDNATPFALFKAMNACYTRISGQNAFVYRIRNGKSFVKTGKYSDAAMMNYYFLENYLKMRFNLHGKAVYMPKDVEYALPTSEKLFVGNIPTGTKFYGDSLAVGVYWENAWGARDIDLSGLNIGGKVGWNSTYNQGGQLMYSGDITNAPNGAVEYLYANNGLMYPTLVNTNVFSGLNTCEYKIIIGKGHNVNYNYMMDPNNRFAEVKCQSMQNQTVLGLMLPEKDRQSFVLLNFGAGQARVAGNNKVSALATQALYQQWKDCLMMRTVINLLGGTISNSNEYVDYDLSLNQLTLDSLMNIFKENENQASSVQKKAV
ncbi:MAG: hypothetical protein AB8B56_05110 [Crocinitomicaceae bacterium]